MSTWSNLAISLQDHEIQKINTLEAGLGELPENVVKIRELITRHEVCHFKFKQHIRIIKDSIILLKPVVDPGKIR